MSAHPAELRALHLAMLDAVLVGEGLVAVADLAAARCGGPVLLVVPRLEVLAPSADVPAEAVADLRRYVLERCRGRVAPVPPGVAAEVPITTGGELLGAVLLLGDAPAGERALERLRLVSVAALTEIALAHARDVPDEGASATLLSALSGGAALGREEIVRRAARGGCDLRGGAVALVCELHVERPRHVVALVRDDWPGALAQHVTDGAGFAPPRLVALLPLRGGGSRSDAAAAALAQRLARHGPVGLAPACEDPAELGAAVESAGLAIDLDTEEREVAIADRERLREHYAITVAPLVRYDDLYGTELVATLGALLAAGGDAGAVAVAQGVPAHRIRYRLEKVRELAGWDPALPVHQAALARGLRCRRALAGELPG
jgi:PucR C-terminal helix-turn-helix domain/GGDEF-like domain